MTLTVLLGAAATTSFDKTDTHLEFVAPHATTVRTAAKAPSRWLPGLIALLVVIAAATTRAGLVIDPAPARRARWTGFVAGVDRAPPARA
jgi:hypothetical protein